MKFFLIVLVAGLMGLAVALIFYLPEEDSREMEIGDAGSAARPTAGEASLILSGLRAILSRISRRSSGSQPTRSRPGIP